MTDDTQGTAPTSANFYYLGASGFEKQLPQAKAAKLFVRPEDLLVLQVTVYQLDPASGFITFDFPPQHIAEQINPISPCAPDDPLLRQKDPGWWATVSQRNRDDRDLRQQWQYPYTPLPTGSEIPQLFGNLVWPAPSAIPALRLNDVSPQPQPVAGALVRWWGDIAVRAARRTQHRSALARHPCAPA